MTGYSTTISLSDRPCVHVGDDTPPTVHRLANSYRCPIGPYAGHAHVLMWRKELLEIATLSEHRLSFGEATGRSVTFKKFYSVKTSHVSAGDINDPDGLWLVSLADPRIHAERFTDTETQIHRVRGQGVPRSAPFLPSGASTTWQGLVDALWPSFLGAAPTLPYTPAGNPDGTHWHGQAKWWALHTMLDAIGCTTAYDPVEDTFAIVRRGDDQALPTIDNTLVFDASPMEGVSDRPANIAVYFADWTEAYGLENDTTPTTDNWLLQPPYDRQTGAVGGVIGTMPIWSDLPRVLDNDGADTNAADRAARMDQYVTNVSQDLDTTRTHKCYEGVVPGLRTGPQVKAVMWRHWGDRYGMVTEFIKHPGEAERGGGGQSLSIPTEIWRTPDLARKTYANYPRVTQTVRAWTTGVTIGQALALQGDNYTDGEVMRHKAGATGPAEKEKVWLRAIDSWDQLKGAIQLAQGDHFVGRMCGIATVAADTRPLYAVRSGAGTGTLVELCLVGQHPGKGVVFDAYLSVWDPAANDWYYSNCSTTVKAIDHRHGVPYPPAGATGLFTPRPSNTYGTIYECVSLDCESAGPCCP